MSLSVIKNINETKEKKRIKKNIRVGYVVKVGDMEENTREVRTRWMMKDVVVYVQAVVGNKKLVVKFEDDQKI